MTGQDQYYLWLGVLVGFGGTLLLLLVIEAGLALHPIHRIQKLLARRRGKNGDN